MTTSSQVLQSQVEVFDRAVLTALSVSDRKILLLCQKELGQLLFMRAVRQERAFRSPDISPTRLIPADALRARGVHFFSGSVLWLGERSPKALMNLENLSHVFLEMPACSERLVKLMSEAKLALSPTGQVVMLDSRLLGQVKRNPLISQVNLPVAIAHE